MPHDHGGPGQLNLEGLLGAALQRPCNVIVYGILLKVTSSGCRRNIRLRSGRGARVLPQPKGVRCQREASGPLVRREDIGGVAQPLNSVLSSRSRLPVRHKHSQPRVIIISSGNSWRSLAPPPCGTLVGPSCSWRAA